MRFEEALSVITNILKEKLAVKNSELIESIDNDVKLFEKVREDLIFNDIAEDKKGVGLIYIAAASVTLNMSEAVNIKNGPEKAQYTTQQNALEAVDKQKNIFLSYGRKDAMDIALSLEEFFKRENFNVWLDKSEIRLGMSWEEQIEKGIEACNIFVALLTPHAVRRPNGVCLDEISMARYKEKKIIPVMVIPCTPPLGIYRLDYVDFTNFLSDERARKNALERILKEIKSDDYNVEGIYASIFSKLKPLDFGSEISRHLSDFTGREWLLSDFDYWLEKENSRIFLLTGDPGTGKSAVMAYLVHKNPSVIAYHFLRADLSDTINSSLFIRSIVSQIATQIESYRNAVGGLELKNELAEDPLTLFKRLVAEPLKAVKLEKPLVILVDGLDEGFLENECSIAKTLAENLNEISPMVRLVLSTRKIPKILNYFERYPRYEIEASMPNNIKDIEAYINKKLQEKELAARIAEKASNPEIVCKSIINAGEGNFLFATKAIEGIRNGLIDPSDPETFPHGLVRIFNLIFERLFKTSESYTKIKKILEVICASYEPLTADEISKFTRLSGIETELAAIASFFQKRNDKYIPFHKSITDWLTGQSTENTQYIINVKSGQLLIVEKLSKDYDNGIYNDYLIKHFCSHLIELNDENRLYKILTDIFYLEKKCKAASVHELAKEFIRSADLVKDPVKKNFLDLIGKALKADINLIARHPETVFQCIYNKCWWYDNQDVEGHYEEPQNGWRKTNPPWKRESEKLYKLMEKWKEEKENKTPGFLWLRTHRPPYVCIGSQQEAIFKGHKNKVTFVAFSNDNKSVFSADMGGKAKIWDILSCRENNVINRIRNNNKNYCKDIITFSADGRIIVNMQSDTVSIYDVFFEKIISSFKTECFASSNISFASDNTKIAFGADDKTIRIKNIVTGQEISSLKGHSELITHLSFSSDGNKIVSASGWENSIKIWSLLTESEIFTIKGQAGCIKCAVFSPDNEKIASGSDNNTIKIWNIYNGHEIITLTGHESDITCLVFSPNGKYLASGSKDKTIRIWDAISGHEIHVIKGHEGEVTCIAFSFDSTKIVSGSTDETVRIWNVLSNMDSYNLNNHTGEITNITFSPENNFLATSCLDKTIGLWDLISGQVIFLKGHESGVGCVTFSNNGMRIVSGSSDKTARIWNVLTGSQKLVKNLNMDVKGIAISSDNKKIIACSSKSESSDKNAIIFDTDTGHEFITFDLGFSNFSEILYISFIFNDKCILMIERDNQYKIYLSETGKQLNATEADEIYRQFYKKEKIIDFQLVSDEIELRVETKNKTPIAWFDEKCRKITPYGTNLTWVIEDVNNLRILTLEGNIKKINFTDQNDS